MGNPTSLSIKELTGELHELILQGRALPYRPLKLSGTMRAEFSWYPGNPVATVQMLGAQEDTTSINGMWKDRFIKTFTDGGFPVIGQTGIAQYDKRNLSDVASLVKVFDGFRRRGQLLEVKWDEITRHGIITKFTQTWLRREDVEWEADFQWMSQGEAVLPVGFAISSSILDIINNIINKVQDLLDAIKKIQDKFAVIASIRNAINNAFNAIAKAASALSGLAKQFVSTVVAPIDAIRSMVSTLEVIKSQAASIVITIEGTTDRAKRAFRKIDFDSLTQEEVIDTSKIFRQAKRAAQKLEREAARQQQETLAATSNQSPLASFIARDGQDLRDISTQYYGTPFEWRRLATYNKIKGSKLTAGTLIIVPKLDTPGA